MLKLYCLGIFHLFTISFLVLVKSKDIYCPEIPPFKHGDTEKSSEPPYSVNTTIKFNCDRGYKGRGSINIKCLPNGKWSDNVPVCQASFICERNTSNIEKGRKCKKSCQTDDNCRGRFKRCLCDGWCGKSCFNPEADCSEPPHLENGSYLVGSLKYGHTVTYKCNEGYILSGKDTRTCRSDRKWSGKLPECIAFSTCGQAGQGRVKIGRVIAGTNAEEGEWPWQALLFQNKAYDFLQIYKKTSTVAGGSVINQKWILSAAHVFEETSKVLIALGLTVFPDEGTVLEDYIQIYDYKFILLHPEYKSVNFDYDAALIRVGNRLKRSGDNFVEDDSYPSGIITYTLYVRPVCLPCLDEIRYEEDIWGQFEKSCDLNQVKLGTSFAKAGTKAYVTGFGKQAVGKNFDRVLPGRLKEGLMEIFNHSICAAAIHKLKPDLPNARYSDRMVCAGSGNKSLDTDACQGDSGGPLVEEIQMKDKSYWVQTGIVSWGFGCGNKFPGFYTSITSVMGWIVLNAEKAEGCKLPKMDKSLIIKEENKKIRVMPRSKLKNGKRITLRCPVDKVLNGSELAVCGREGWDVPMTQTCDKKKTCEELVGSQFGILKFKSDAKKPPYPSGTKVTLSCQVNYEISGNNEATCGADGKWSNGLGDCKIKLKPCGEPQVPDFGSIKFDSKRKSAPLPPGTKATLTCDYNYKITGTESATCGDDGQWSSDLGTCEKDDPGCTIKIDDIPIHNSVFDGFFAMLPEDRQFNPGDFIIVHCLRTFNMMGTTCNNNKKWEPALEDLFC